MRRINTAYTFVEMAIVVAIFSFLIGTTYLLLTKGKDSTDSLNVQAELASDARRAMDEMLKDLAESDSITVAKTAGAIPFFTDPLNNQQHQILVFASARGDSAVNAEDGIHPNNNYAHLDADYNPSWRSAVIYFAYVNADGIQQLCKYLDYGPNTTYYSQAGLFPFTVTGITATQISLLRANGSTLNISRDSGRVLANYVASEDSNNNGVLDANENDGNTLMPADNADNVLDRGADITATSKVVQIKLFLAKRETSLTQGRRLLTVTLTGSSQLRR